MEAPLPSSVLTIGNFDGVHLGHRALIDRVLQEARAAKVPSVVMTFEPHPVKVLHPDRHLKRIFDSADQALELQKLGVDLLINEPFSREFSQLPPERFVLDWIYRPFSPAKVVVGYDFSFGAGRVGSIQFLKQKALELGFEIEILPPVKVGDILVSSSRIRQALAEGDVSLAKKLLQRPFYLSGLIVKGAGRGRTLGIPTANLNTHAETVPAPGVYCAWAEIHGKRHPAMVNIGFNPTFQLTPHQPAIEAHLLDFSADIYGEELNLYFMARIRDEQKFSSAQALVQQIKLDILRGREILSGPNELG